MIVLLLNSSEIGLSNLNSEHKTVIASFVSDVKPKSHNDPVLNFTLQCFLVYVLHDNLNKRDFFTRITAVSFGKNIYSMFP